VEPSIRYAINSGVGIPDETAGGGPIALLSGARINDLCVVSEDPRLARFIVGPIERLYRMVA
jgi:hypothetical protein